MAQQNIRDLEAREEGIYLESVGTWLHADGMTYPVNADNTVTMPDADASLDEQWDSEGFRLEDIDPDGEGYDWWNALSKLDRVAVTQAKVDIKSAIRYRKVIRLQTK